MPAEKACAKDARNGADCVLVLNAAPATRASGFMAAEELDQTIQQARDQAWLARIRRNTQCALDIIGRDRSGTACKTKARRALALQKLNPRRSLK
jgi:hypothetical protein